VSFKDGAIHACGQAKVIRIYDKTAHRASLAGEAFEQEQWDRFFSANAT